jgi:hypothetical protein
MINTERLADSRIQILCAVSRHPGELWLLAGRQLVSIYHLGIRMKMSNGWSTDGRNY